MARITKTFSRVDGQMTFMGEAYTDDGKVWRWTSNDAACPLDSAESYGIPVNVEAQRAARDAELSAFAERYRKAQAKRTPEQVAEERAMARAAHGRGVKLVNVFTGETYTT